jgi:hypothetical protein
MVNEDEVAPPIFTPPFLHWYVRPEPVATTLNVTLLPAHIVWLTGCVVIAGAVFTVKLTVLDVTAGGQVPLTTTS